MNRISELQLTNFRGASKSINVTFDVAKPITIIFGENGTGKTTLVDAIELVAKKTFGSIAEKGLGTVVHQYVRTQGATAALEVEMATQAGHRWKATLAGRNAQVANLTQNAVLPPIEILRRKNLIALVEAQPATRYQTLKHFLDIQAIEKNEAVLKKQLEPLEKRWQNADATRDATKQTLTDTWQNMRLPAEQSLSMEDWVKARLGQDPAISRTQADKLGLALTQVAAFTAAADSWPQTATPLHEAQTQVEQTQEKLAQATDRIPQLIDVLEKAAQYVEPQDIVCPVCQQDRSGEALRATLDARLLELREQITQQNAHRQAKKQLEQCEAVAHTRYSELTRMALAARQALAATQGEISAEIVTAMPWPTAQKPSVAALYTTTLFGALATALEACMQPLRTQYDAVAGQIELYDNLRDQHERFVAADADVAEVFAIKDAFDQAIKVAENCRKAFIQRVLDSITQDINDLYTDVHPKEQLGISRMEMEPNPNRPGSIQQRIRFQGVDLTDPPQAYLSESHLDTLGFCIWLALAKRAGAIIVLDDVFTSVDAPHFRRLTELLHQQAPNFPQVIITTHNRQWHEQYKRGHTEVHLLKLERWTLTHGVRVFAEQIALAELASAINAVPFQRQAVASQAGIVLETLLDEVALTFGCSLPHKRGDAYTLGELLSGTTKLLNVAKVQRIIRQLNGQVVQPATLDAPIEIKKLLADLNQFTKIRNEVGCHFNPDGAHFTDQDVADFGTATLAFANALICPTCGQLPQKEMVTFRGCRCPKHKTQFTPMEKPS